MRGLEKTALDGADRQTDRHTDGHGDSMANSAQWGRVGENKNVISRFDDNFFIFFLN